MPIFVGESEEKGSKRRIGVKLVNKDQNYDPFYSIFRAQIRLRSFTKKILATHAISKENPGLARH